MGLVNLIKKVLGREKWTASSKAYDLWSASYDRQPGNLMLDLDEQVFEELFTEVEIQNLVVLDVGCGTGRHWPRLLQKKPARLLGFDSSPGMISRLKEKFPGAEAFVSSDHHLPGLADSTVHLLVSTLTIAHIESPEDYFREWFRVLAPGGFILLTDYHPAALEKGAKRTFQHQDQTIAIRNFVHPVNKIREMAGQLGLDEWRFTERIIDERVKRYYEEQNALHLYNSFSSVPIIYGILLKKQDATP
jgi:ubiquinone/menaquinone biosynthesis C-methylase UbiE